MQKDKNMRKCMDIPKAQTRIEKVGCQLRTIPGTVGKDVPYEGILILNN